MSWNLEREGEGELDSGGGYELPCYIQYGGVKARSLIEGRKKERESRLCVLCAMDHLASHIAKVKIFPTKSILYITKNLIFGKGQILRKRQGFLGLVVKVRTT